ncbi:MAG: hypothetical protein KY457_14175 [Actinobacteria bacterium]|nr:hypothetical protein [Actinomycetota bacterium]
MDTPSPSATSPDAFLSAMSSDVDPEVASFLAEVRAEYRAPLANDVATAHLRMILAEAAVAPTAPALGDRWARRARRIAAVGAVKIALTATAAAAATGTGLAATNNLPAPAQAVVADAAGLVGINFPTPETPGDPSDGPGVGEGGVPALLDSTGEDVVLPGKAGDAPGHNKDDGRPATPEQAPAADERGNAGGEVRGEDRADERPAPPASGDAARTDDTPAADRPDAPATRPAPPAAEGAGGEAGAAEAGAPGDTPPAERPEQAGNGRTAEDG